MQEYAECLKNSQRNQVISLLLAAITLALYWPVTGFEFNNYDDALYITENPVVQSGFTINTVAWAFRTGYGCNWHPLTWLSHMLDCEIYGLNAGGHHFTNVLFHVANTLLLFGLLRRLTGAVWRAAFVAALFAWHPLHVESVAFVAERKDVLSTFFAFLTLLAYCSWVKVPGWPRYALALLLFALGLMSKPMLVTLPLMMLLLDFWPLGRLELDKFQSWCLRVKEKLPFFALTLISCYVTFRVQESGGAMSLRNLTFAHRVANALNSYVGYIARIFWPRDLAVFYPYPRDLPLGRVISAGIIISLISAGVLWFVRRRPHLAVGWYWFLISLVPVIGLVQVGGQAMADRYTYIPSIGLFMVVAWEVPSRLAAWPQNRRMLALVASVALAGCLAVTSRQLQYWKNSVTLFTHAIKVTKDNALAHCNLGEALATGGKPEAALAEFNEALRINTNYPQALNDKGALLQQLGRVDEAIEQFKLLLRSQPHWYLAQRNFGLALFEQGKIDEAIVHFRAALRSNPADDRSLANLGIALARQGKLDEAMVQYRAALQIAPNAYAENALGSALEAQGKLDEAVRHYRAAVKIKPNFAEARNNLGAVLNAQGQFAEAQKQFVAALAVKPDFAEAHCNLGNALLSEGKVNEAAAQYAKTLRLQSNSFSAHYNLANILFEQKQWGPALSHYQRALRLNPAFADVHVRLGMVLSQQGDDSGAIVQYRAALRLNPHTLSALKKLAWLLATSPNPKLRNGTEAVHLATQATQENPADAEAWDSLAEAEAVVGQFGNAVSNAKKALALATASHQNNLAGQVQNRLQLYESGHSLPESNFIEHPQ
ncbi:MAG: tetratricopeptide repeat protein [Verrucomicrobiota bacterium]|nr:tetratricopeptide repeat protein [Verrucomicrobiota bacterium]